LTVSLSFTKTPSTHTHTLSLHDALPISYRDQGQRPLGHAREQLQHAAALAAAVPRPGADGIAARSGRAWSAGNDPGGRDGRHGRSEEHTSELQSRFDLVCRLLLEKKKKK